MKFLPVLLTISLGLVSCLKKEEKTSEKVLNIAVSAKIKGMDPIYANDLYSGNEVARVYEGLLQYHYLKRPYTLIPNLAAEMPTTNEAGTEYTFKIKKGVKFHDNKCFPNGKGRELVAEDFLYSIKRLADPKLQGAGWWVIDGKIKGLNEWRAKAADADSTDYSAPVEGMQAVDKYTIKFSLTKPFPQFLYALAMPFFYVVPKEAVTLYGKEFLNHPVGTGPFILPEFRQTSRIVYTKNPNFRDKKYPSEASPEFAKRGLLKDAGKKLPLVDKLVVNIMTEAQPRWLKFQKGEIDFISIPKDQFDNVVTPEKELSQEQKKKQITLLYAPSLDITYSAFNHSNKLFRNKKLRQAMSMAYNGEEANKLFYNSMALEAQSIVPPGIAGHLEDYKNPYKVYDVEKAKKLLAEAGYPNGQGLPEITYDTSSSTTSRQMGEYFAKSMKKLGINIKVITNPWPELQKKIAKKQTMIHGLAWGADYPDAENFLQLLYGPHAAPGSNGSNYSNPEFDKKFEKARVMQDSPERTQLYQELNKVAAEEMPLLYGVHRMVFVMNHTWLKNYVLSDLEQGNSQYYNIDLDQKRKVKKESF